MGSHFQRKTTVYPIQSSNQGFFEEYVKIYRNSDAADRRRAEKGVQAEAPRCDNNSGGGEAASPAHADDGLGARGRAQVAAAAAPRPVACTASRGTAVLRYLRSVSRLLFLP